MGMGVMETFLVEAALLHYANIKWGEPYWHMWQDRDRTGEAHEIPGLGTVTVVACNLAKDISYAEHSEEVWMIFEVQGTLYKKSGQYTSYIGTEWVEGMRIVVPKTSTVTYYEEN